MSVDWGDLVARSRGMATHLLHRGELAALARAQDLPGLAADLARRGFAIEEESGSPATLDLAVRRRAAAELRNLARWSGPRSEILAVVFEDEDRRSLRTILRGIAQRAAPERRLAGLLPTPALPERVLQELARQSSPADVASLLMLWKNPYGPALREGAARAEPDLLGLEIGIDRTFAARALRAARRAGRRGVLLWYVRQTIDLENALSALVLSGEDTTARVDDVFLPGGAAISREMFEAVVRTGTFALAAQRLSSAFAGSPLARPFADAAAGAGDIERLVLGSRIAQLRQRALREPLGPASVLHYALRVRAEVLDLRHIIWGISLGAPRSGLEKALVSSP
jgi:vacuolar-type H+-ATPase subunit C/Vma6